MSSLPNADDILKYFKNWDLDEESRAYLEYHCFRYEMLLEETSDIIRLFRNSEKDKTLKVLDIGPGYQTILLQNTFSDVIVNTLGFEDSRFKIRPQEKHYQLNLNDIPLKEPWPEIEKHDIILMAEVIEHLYTSPLIILKFINHCLRTGGYCIVQTPNACSLDKRLKMLLGDNPFEEIRENLHNPGHFREYTLKEMLTIGEKAGFKKVHYSVNNYFCENSRRSRFFSVVSSGLPQNFRSGITVIFQKTPLTFLNVNLCQRESWFIRKSGFYALEKCGNETACWTNGKAKIVISNEEECHVDSIQIDILYNSLQGARLQILVNRHELFHDCIQTGGWSKRFKINSLFQQDEITIELLSDTFIPAETIQGSSDHRCLGVLVKDVRLL